MTKKIVTFKSIKWDTDGEKVKLPKEVEALFESDFNTEMDGADFLSDIFGYCVFSFNFTEKESKDPAAARSYRILKS